MSENCREIEPLLSPYLDGELDADVRRRVEGHVEACDSCRATLEEWRRAENVLRSVQPARSDVAWERLAQRVEAAIDVEDERARAAAAATTATASRASLPARSAGRHWWLWSGSGALVAAALVALFWPWVVPPSEPPVLRTIDGGRGVGSLQESEVGPPMSPPASEPQVESARESAAAPATDDARLGKSAPEASSLGEDAAASAPEKKSRADAAEPLVSDAKEKTLASEVPPPSEAERSKGSYGLMSTEAGRLEEEKAPPASAPPAENIAPAPRAERAAAPVEAMPPPPGASTKSLVRPGRAASLEDDRAGAAPDSSFAKVASSVEAALTDGSERPLRDAASEVDAFLAAFPQSPHRVDALADRMRLLARLSALDPDLWCASARLAVDEWQQAAHDPPAELQNVAQEVDERCGAWGG